MWDGGTTPLGVRELAAGRQFLSQDLGEAELRGLVAAALSDLGITREAMPPMAASDTFA